MNGQFVEIEATDLETVYGADAAEMSVVDMLCRRGKRIAGFETMVAPRIRDLLEGYCKLAHTLDEEQERERELEQEEEQEEHVERPAARKALPVKVSPEARALAEGGLLDFSRLLSAGILCQRYSIPALVELAGVWCTSAYGGLCRTGQRVCKLFARR